MEAVSNGITVVPRRVAAIAGLCAVIGGAGALLGWMINVPRLTDWRNDGISMFPNTAVCAVLCGLSLLINAARPTRAIALLACLVILIAGLTLIEHVTGVSLRIDTLLFHRTWGQRAAAAPMRMGPPATISFLMLGTALLLLGLSRPARGGVAALLGVGVVAISMLSVIGYLYGAHQMYSIPRVTAIAQQTASVILILGIGVIASVSERMPMRSILQSGTAGMLARRALPVLFIISLTLGWARVWIERVGLVDTEFGTAMRTLVELALLSSLLWWAVEMVGSHERALTQSEAEVRRQSRQLATFLETAAICLHRVGPDGTILWANDAELQTLGYARDEYVGRNIADFHVDQDVIADILARLHRGEKLFEREARMRCRDGEIKIVLIDSSVLWDQGRFVHTQCFTRDITQSRAAEAALREAKEAAEAANIAKDNFVATLSHELRTPLTPVLATLSAWENAADFPPSLRDDMQMVRRNIDLEARLIDDLLDLTGIVRGKFTLNLEPLDVHELMRTVVRMYRGELEAGRFTVTQRLAATNCIVRGDPGRLQQVFWNVLKNAVKFTPQGGQIEVSTRNADDGDRVQILVRDNGLGISREALARLFRPFEQGSDEIVKRYGGLGLGLTIARSLLIAHGGEIAAESDGLGSGATFILTLPCVASRLAAQATPVASPSSSSSPSKLDGAAATAPVVGAAASRTFRLLLVEDHADTARVLARLLSGNGHTVEVANSIRQAMAAFDRDGKFDFMVSDLGLPDGSGVDLIRQIRQQLGLGIPAIALSGYGMEEDIARCKAAGFDDHVTKPVNLQKLEETIQRVAGAQRGSGEAKSRPQR
jgi:PAS domain S-box-containing protein